MFKESQNPSTSKTETNECLKKLPTVLHTLEIVDSKGTYTTVQLKVQFPSLEEDLIVSSKELDVMA